MEKKVEIPLSNFQQWMQQLLLDPFKQTSIEPKNLLPTTIKTSSLEEVIHHSKKLTAQEHLAIYQRSYIARLRNCMSQQFSALEYALGEDIFCAFADDYLASKPSYNYNLALLGKHFTEYLEINRPDAAEAKKEEWIDFIIELARFEYAIGIIFEEKSDENYSLANNNTVDDKLKLVPIFELFKFEFPVRPYYSEFKNEKRPVLPYANKSYCVVLRHHFKLAVYDLHKEQYDFLCLLKNGLNVSKAILKFKEDHKTSDHEFNNIWSSWKARWVKEKFFRI